jgi:hypothetical protein
LNEQPKRIVFLKDFYAVHEARPCASPFGRLSPCESAILPIRLAPHQKKSRREATQ